MKQIDVMTTRLWTLFASFFKIGVFTFGGGYAMIPLIQREVIDRRRWIDGREFLDLLTLAQSSPGPISLNTAIFVGYKLRGVRGAVSSLLGVVVPSFVIILLIALFFAEFRTDHWVDAAFRGMRPAVVALILAPVLSMSRGMHKVLYGVIAGTALLIWGVGFSPVYLLLLGGIGGVIWSSKTAKRLKR